MTEENTQYNGFIPEGQPLGDIHAQSFGEEMDLQREFEALLEDYRHTRKGDKAELIRKAFLFAKKAHGNDRRLNGDLYLQHPLAVARIVAREMGLGSTSISAALLHDVVKSTRVSFSDIEREFGPRITGLVRGLDSISGGNVRFVTAETCDSDHPAPHNAEEQAENFRNLLLTFSEDVRVILVKVADRLHNMRTLSALSEFKQKRIASETLYLYAPIADRMGLYKIKQELEELGLEYEYPEEYQQLKTQMQEAEENCQLVFKTFAAPVRALLDGLGLKYTFQYRMKTIYSIWRKMHKKHVSFDEVYDLFATRIVFQPSSPENEKTDCWRIYTALTSIYKIHPDRIRDWISHPKQSGYEALQVTVMGPDSNWIEVQIRSERMNEQAEEGTAAHWKYKAGKPVDDNLSKWVQEIKDILDNPAPNATDFLDQINLNLLSSTIYVFTKTGELFQLPKESTALDFAFSVHTDIGIHAEAVRIDHELKPLNTVLENGQQVEVITSENEHICEQWIDWVHTTKARAKVRQWINKRNGETQPQKQKKQNKIISSLLGIVKKKKKEKENPPHEEFIPRSSTIELSGIDGRGLLNTITRVISEQCTANITNIHLECKDGLFKGYISLDTGEQAAINRLCSALKQIHEIEKAHKISQNK